MTASTNARTEIGDGAFIGSDTALVAPVKVGAGAITAAGSVITQDVAADALAIARGQQTEKPGWAKAFREQEAERETLMCGIVGIAGTRDVAPVILEALKRLEYRGYDSAGIATLVHGQIERRRSPGKLSKLEAVLQQSPLHGQDRHRPHPLGHPWRAHRIQCPSPCHGARRHRP